MISFSLLRIKHSMCVGAGHARDPLFLEFFAGMARSYFRQNYCRF